MDDVLARNPRRGVLTAMGVLIVFGLLVHIWGFYFSSVEENSFESYSSIPTAIGDGTPELMQYLWTPYLHSLDNPEFITKEGYNYTLSNETHRWTDPLGKRLLILDVDTRLDDGPGSMMNESFLDSKTMTGRTGGMMNHYLYAMVHGYDYKFVRAPEYPDRHGTWVKVPMIKEALKTHDFVVFLDADAVFMYPEMPLEWLMNLWNITDTTLVAMANDPNSENNRDAKGKVMQNKGFVVAQQSERTQELFDNWDNCPTDVKYKGCKRWAHDWAHEQAAFANHVRYDYNSTDEIGEIPCMDGNGSPYIGDKTCGGVFIRHHWFHKYYPVRNLHKMILDTFVNRIHKQFHLDKAKTFVDASKKTYPLEHVLG
ncbi:hypothetical protein FZEAL_5040 [Fusarium zealandicum]|uniref:Nucleotide-diphospho-sugar transferase domain-containing protein n=1 Tax=Fusarium zealandicum TaxID=1053134 RepID=A0A8H4XKV4_9HYPO|nr:hypothetical protein FZEAL_5040 [Fusarium zealandicum]